MTVTEQNNLVLACRPLAYALARRWWRLHGGSLPDLRGEAFLAVVRASRKYDPTRGVAFATLAHRYVTTELCNGAKRARRRVRTCSLTGFDAAAHDDAEPVVDTLPEYLTTALATLTPRQRQAVQRIALDGARIVDVAGENGTRWCTANKCYRGALARLAEVLGDRKRI